MEIRAPNQVEWNSACGWLCALHPHYTGSQALPVANRLLITLACGLMALNVLGSHR